MKDYLSSRTISEIDEKTLELVMYVMQCNKMVPEMKELVNKISAKNGLKFNHYITEAICNQPSDGSGGFYSEQVSTLFPNKIDKQSDMYTICMMKALLKEGDTKAALRVLDEGERAQLGKKAAIEKYYINIFDHCFNSKSENQSQVSFFPDLLKEREDRIAQEIAHAGKISAHQKAKVEEKYRNVDLSNHMPVSFSEFKKKHFNMMRTTKNNMQQMILMKMVRSAVKKSDYKNIDTLFDYLTVAKEEQELRTSARNQIEAYAKIFKPKGKFDSLKQAEDPLRVLFEYVRKPYDTVESLVSIFNPLHFFPLKHYLTKLFTDFEVPANGTRIE